MDILRKAEAFAKRRYAKNDPSHQWTHIENVMNRALELAKHFEGIDYESLKLAVIFHDVDYRSYEAHVDASVAVAQEFLKEEGYPKDRIEKVTEIMLDHSSPHRKKRGDATLLEGKIIYDADKSIFITNQETHEKYYPKLYLEESRKLVDLE